MPQFDAPQSRVIPNFRQYGPGIRVPRVSWVNLPGSERPRKPVRVLADYPLFSEDVAEEWANNVLDSAKEAGKILDYQILYTASNPWGLQFITFTYDVNAPIGETAEVRDACEAMTRELLHDGDASVRFVTPL